MSTTTGDLSRKKNLQGLSFDYLKGKSPAELLNNYVLHLLKMDHCNPPQPPDGLGRPFYGNSSGVFFSDLNDQRWNCHRPVGAAAQLFPPFPHLFVPRGVMLARTGERGGVFFIILVYET